MPTAIRFITRIQDTDDYAAAHTWAGAAAFSSTVTLNNNTAYQAKTVGDAPISLLSLNASDNLLLGYGIDAGNDVRISPGGGAKLTVTGAGDVGIGTTSPGSLLELAFATENMELVNAGSAAATEQDWIEVQVGNNTGYIRVYAAK